MKTTHQPPRTKEDREALRTVVRRVGARLLEGRRAASRALAEEFIASEREFLLRCEPGDPDDEQV